jgi:hypothetical protein
MVTIDIKNGASSKENESPKEEKVFPFQRHSYSKQEAKGQELQRTSFAVELHY